MTRKEAEALPLGARVLIDGEQLARLWCADAKWTADMKGQAVVHPIRPDGTERNPAPHNALLIPRRRLTVAA